MNPEYVEQNSGGQTMEELRVLGALMQTLIWERQTQKEISVEFVYGKGRDFWSMEVSGEGKRRVVLYGIARWVDQKILNGL